MKTEIIQELIARYPVLASCELSVTAATELLISCYRAGNKLLLCGNGGSCADSLHIVGELMKGFLKKRPLTEAQQEQMRAKCAALPEAYLNQLQNALPAIALCEESALNTAFSNDVDPELLYAQQVFGYGRENDVLICISTSGNAKNAVAAAMVAKGLGLRVLSLTGAGGGKLRTLSDICICVPETETYKIQELHLPVYHALCAAVEAAFFEV